MPTMGERLIHLRERSGLSLEAVAVAAHYRGRSSVQKFFSPTYDVLQLERSVALRLAKALAGHGSPPINPDEVISLAGGSEVDKPTPAPTRHKKVLLEVAVYPVYFVERSEVEEGLGFFDNFLIDLDMPFQYCWTPPGLTDRKSVYGMTLRDWTLFPRFKPGELLFLDDYDHPKIGDDVCIYKGELDNKEPGTAFASILFATYERQTATSLIFRSLDGEATFTRDRDHRTKMHRLITLGDALNAR